jgi:hypothetical protein
MRYLWIAMLWIGGCVQGDLTASKAPAALDRAYFDCKVQPVLTKSCAMFVCHGDGRRFFRIYARNRLRLGGAERDRNAFLRADEREANYLAARAMVDAEDSSQSLLLLKPLQESAGGYFHGGETKYGAGDVFATTDDADYAVLKAWVDGATDDPSCIEPGSDR